MKNWQRWLPLILLVMVLGLAACGGAAAPAAPAESAAPAAEASLDTLPVNVDVATVYDLQDHPDVYLLDVREQEEYDAGHIPGINLLPMSSIQSRLDEIPKDKEVIVTCRSGNRSAQVTEFLRNNGYDNVHNMTGGILDWQAAGYPVER